MTFTTTSASWAGPREGLSALSLFHLNKNLYQGKNIVILFLPLEMTDFQPIESAFLF
jgi:hypothetical protein